MVFILGDFIAVIIIHQMVTFESAGFPTVEALEEFMRADRVLSVYPPDFRALSGLGAMLRITVETVANSIMLEQKRS